MGNYITNEASNSSVGIFVGDNCFYGRSLVDGTMILDCCIDIIAFVVVYLGDGKAWWMM